MATQPTPIQDKNGKHTTVHKNVDKDVEKNTARVAAVALPKKFNPKKALDVWFKFDDDNDEEASWEANTFRTATGFRIDYYHTGVGQVRSAEFDSIEKVNAWYENEGFNDFSTGDIDDDDDDDYDADDAPVEEAVVQYEAEEDVPAYFALEGIPRLRAIAIEMGDFQNEDWFDTHFTPELIRNNAHQIYDYMRAYGTDVDSVTREALFNYASESLGIDYDVLYNAWLGEKPAPFPTE